jgi:gliding motility-associated-like protein
MYGNSFLVVKAFVTIFFLYLSNFCVAQNEANIWYFGKNAGLDFSSGNPVAVSNGQINTDEGVASICDSNGALLFYTDGEKVWNAVHTVMPNGAGLFGSFSSSQSAIIVPFISDPKRYYIFTVDQLGYPNGLSYSIVNMSLDNGRGDIELKNQQLLTPVCEKITAVKHCNGKDIWVITHLWYSDAFYAYLVTSSGISTTSVISHSGRVVNGNVFSTIGYLKASPDGSKLAAAHNLGGLDLFNFNNSTGIVSNPQSLFLPLEYYQQPYGVEFSPNSQLLYTTVFYYDVNDFKNYNVLLQYNVSLPTTSAIIASKEIIYKYNLLTQEFGSLQTAVDGKIYMAQFTLEPHISVINSPDQIGASCNFQFSTVQLARNTNSTLGLPTFIQSYWLPGFTFTGACNGTQLQFNYARPVNINTVKWDFGDPASGANNVSVLDNPSHLFTAEGLYTVKLIRFGVCGTDTIKKQVQAGQLSVNLGVDTVFCGAPQYKLDPQTPGTNSYLWQDSSINPVLNATKTGLYWVEVKNTVNGCIKRDSVLLTFKPNPQFTLGPDITKCSGENVTLTATTAGANYLWSTGAASNTLQVSQPGIYWVDVNLNGCVKRDSVQVIFNPTPVINLGADKTLCEGQTQLLDAQNIGANYLWQNGSTAQTFLVSQSSTYIVIVDKQNCFAKDTINIAYNLKPKFSLGADQLICTGNTIILNPQISDVSYLWQDGSVKPSYTITKPGLYYLTATNNCGVLSDSVLISKGVCNLYIPNSFTPNGDSRNDAFKASYGENVTEYQLQVFNRYGQIVFSATDKNKGWDGSYKGTGQPYGSYVWVIQYKTAINSNLQKLQGTVLLIR